MRDKLEIAHLIVAIGRGERDAFDRLYHATASQLLGVALRIVRDRARAEDVLQEAFTRVWLRAQSFDPAAGHAMGWLSAIVRHGAIDFIRRTPSARQVDEQYDGWFENLADPRDEEADMMAAGALRHCLGALDETTRAYVVEAYCTGLSGKELADRYDRPLGTIKGVLRRGLAALKTCLDENA